MREFWNVTNQLEADRAWDVVSVEVGLLHGGITLLTEALGIGIDDEGYSLLVANVAELDFGVCWG